MKISEDDLKSLFESDDLDLGPKEAGKVFLKLKKKNTIVPKMSKLKKLIMRETTLMKSGLISRR